MLTTVVLCLAGVVFNALMVGPDALKSAGRGLNDFRQLYTAGLLAGNAGMYDPERGLRAQAGFVGEANANPRLPVNRLPFYGLFLKPLTLLPYTVALRFWFAFQFACVCGFVASLPPAYRLQAAVVCCWSYPLFFALAIGQDLPLMLLAAGLSARLYHTGRFVWAGLALSVCLIKFHLLLLLPVFILARKERRLAAGFLTGCGIAFLLSVAAAGWSFPVAYLNALRGPNANLSQSTMPNLNGLLTTLHAPPWAEFVGAFVVVLAAWFIARRSGTLHAVAGTTAGSLLVSHHAYVQDCSILIPGILGLLVVSRSGFTRLIAFFLLVPAVYIASGQGLLCLVPTVLMLLLVLALAFEARAVRGLPPDGNDFSKMNASGERGTSAAHPVRSTPKMSAMFQITRPAYQ
jgi:hypothetical protein